MADEPRSKIIQENPIGKGLDRFRASFNTVCNGAGIASSPDVLQQLSQEDLQDLALDLLLSLQGLRAPRLLRSSGHGKHLLTDLSRLNSAVISDDFDLDHIKPLLESAIADDIDDALIWEQVYLAVTESTPPPWPIASSLQQTPWLHNTSSFANSSEYRQDVDRVLKLELGPLYVGLRDFRKTYFGSVTGLEAASEAVFEKCMEGSSPLFNNGWRGWPKDANQDDVLSWFADLNETLVALAEGHRSTPSHRRRPLAQPNKPIQGSTGERKIDIGFVSNPRAKRDSRCHWSEILVPGELKSNPSADIASKAWLDLGRYAREVLAAQDTRRFVLGFTICGSFMRIWEFDRLGGIASEQFDINHDGLQFVSTVLGFLWMSEEQLGFDPTITSEGGRRFITIQRNGQTERLVIDKLMKRAPCIAGRATTCWKAHREEDPQIPLVVKDSWQYTEREEEGELLKEATEKGVVNVARYYHHETVFVHDKADDIRGNVRGGLDITQAGNYRPERSVLLSNMTTISGPREGRSSSAAGVKRSSSQTGVFLPPKKRSCSTSPTKAPSNALPNRVHLRTIIRDYGTPIYKASSPSALLIALKGCIEGYESLFKAGFLHRDISINNLMINEDADNPSWPSFLIDLDLAIKVQRESASGARGKTGTRAFMAIGALLGEQHSFMHDLESFFWVLFWICIHYDIQGKGIRPTEFDSWNYESDNKLVRSKVGTIGDESIFLKIAEENFTSHYQPLIPLVNRLRRKVFPNGERWKREDLDLYSKMRDVLRAPLETEDCDS
ncbi:hypothetical protein ACO1O0_007060 [Amphichorda felina]